MNAQNKERLKSIVKELTIISEITLLGGLVMVSIGTYLGGVWANESWGRYWDGMLRKPGLWSPYWSMHSFSMRFIPGLQSIYSFNFASLFGFGTVIMTYFGVNYYLSGLQFLCCSDPVPIPTQVYVTTIILAILSIVSYLKYRKIWKN